VVIEPLGGPIDEEPVKITEFKVGSTIANLKLSDFDRLLIDRPS
jgi:hypothetical protein